MSQKPRQPEHSQRFPFLPDHSHLHENRYAKVQAMRDQGIDPYPVRFQPTHLAGDILSSEAEYLDREDKTVVVMGRVLTVRRFGKAAFFHIRDRSGEIQVYINKKVLSEPGFQAYKEFLDNGDLVGVAGTVFRTKTGEITIQARELTIIAKSTRPLPEKWHGLTDIETRYRQRYVDLIANPEVVETFKTRSRMVAGLRRYLEQNEFLEVETPILQAIYGGGSAIPFSTHHNALDIDLFLRIAPELYLKRLVVGGMHRVYELNRNFRNEGISTQHNPEFTMLELYAAGWNAGDMMDFTEALVIESVRYSIGGTTVTLEGRQIDLAASRWPRMTILEALEKYQQIRVNWSMTLEEVKACADRPIPKEIRTGTDAIIHLFEEYVEDSLVEPVFITEFPKSVSPLAKSKADDPETADRFELYIRTMEVANGFSELNDPAEQYARFAEQVERRRGGDLEAIGVIDEDYVRALEFGMPPAAGLGVGIDRLAMVATNSPSIRDVILFPQLKPEVIRKDAPKETSEGE